MVSLFIEKPSGKAVLRVLITLICCLLIGANSVAIVADAASQNQLWMLVEKKLLKQAPVLTAAQGPERNPLSFVELMTVSVSEDLLASLSHRLRSRSYVIERHTSSDAAVSIVLWIFPEPREDRTAPIMINVQSDEENVSEDINSALLALLYGDASQREEAVELLADRGSVEVVHSLGEALNDSEPTVRDVALHALTTINSPQSVQIMGDALDEVNSTEREDIVYALGHFALHRSNFSDSRALAARFLYRARQDDNPSVRQAAMQLLEEWQQQLP